MEDMLTNDLPPESLIASIAYFSPLTHTSVTRL